MIIRIAAADGAAARSLPAAVITGARSALIASLRYLAALSLLFCATNSHAQSTAENWCNQVGLPGSYRTVMDESGTQAVGFVCAIAPSRTNAATEDRHPAPDMSDLDDLLCGYGSHAIGVPVDPNSPIWNYWGAARGVYVHFVGTYVRPYDSGGYLSTLPLTATSAPQDCKRCATSGAEGIWNPSTGICRDPTNGRIITDLLDTVDPAPTAPPSDQYESLRVIEEGVQAGFLVIQLAHANNDSNGDICNSNQDGVDNCNGKVRREIATGTNASRLIAVNAANSLRSRLKYLISYVQDHSITLPAQLDGGTEWGVADWTRVRLGGHSGGSAHAYYAAKFLAELDADVVADGQVENVCLLSGPYDTPDGVCGGEPCGNARPDIADWYLDDSHAYPPLRMRALVSTKDSSYLQFARSHELLGLVEGMHVATILRDQYCLGDNGPSCTIPFSGHAAIELEEDLAWARTLACFAPVADDHIPDPMINLNMDHVCETAAAEFPIYQRTGAKLGRAEFLAMNAGDFGPSDDQCTFWETSNGQATGCVFDEDAYEHDNGIPARDAHRHYESFGVNRGLIGRCSTLPNTVRSARGY